MSEQNSTFYILYTEAMQPNEKEVNNMHRDMQRMRGGTCGCANFLTDMPSGCSPYVRAYVVETSYDNCADPEAALMQGTYFSNLYMPFVQAGDMARSCGCGREE